MNIVYILYRIHKSPAEVGKKAHVLPEALSKKRSVLAGRRCLFLQAKTMEGKTMVVLSLGVTWKKLMHFGPAVWGWVKRSKTAHGPNHRNNANTGVLVLGWSTLEAGDWLNTAMYGTVRAHIWKKHCKYQHSQGTAQIAVLRGGGSKKINKSIKKIIPRGSKTLIRGSKKNYSQGIETLSCGRGAKIASLTGSKKKYSF